MLAANVFFNFAKDIGHLKQSFEQRCHRRTRTCGSGPEREAQEKPRSALTFCDGPQRSGMV
jgi:hypothetical protein